MYTIYADDNLIYTPDVEELCLYNIVLSMEDNSAGTLSFNMISTHPLFDSLRKLATLIQVKNDGRTIWKGRIISDDSNIDNIKAIQCEGKLAFLNDSIFPEFSFSGSPDLLFRRIIENHNSQVGEKQRFLVGDVTVKDNNDYIVRSSESALKTWNALKEKCFQSALGGHLQVRYEADGDYIDWLDDYKGISRQPISFGKNIIDLLINTSAAETYTAIRPQGASINGKRINIASVNDGKDYIIDEEKAAEYGVIYADPDESIWDDVTLPENLLIRAQDRLKSGIVLKKTIEVRAIDLNLTDEQAEALNVCTYVQVISKLHGVESYYLLSKAEIHIDAPENTQYTLGAVKMVLTDANKIRQGSFIKAVEEIEAAIPKDVGQLNNDVNYITETKVKEIINMSGAAAPVISVDTETEDTYILNIQTAAGSFDTPNLKGCSGAPGMTAYESALGAGFDGTEAEWLASLKGEAGIDGKSAYRVAVDNGYEGTEEEWLGSLKGAPGDEGQSAYEAALENGFAGNKEQWLASLKGEPGNAGKTAYEVALGSGFAGTEAEWLASLKGVPGDAGKSAYDIALVEGFIGSTEEWLASLKGEQGKDGTVKIEDIDGVEGAVLQFKDGRWQAVPLEGDGKEIMVLDSPAAVQENEEFGKLVDALVIKQVFQSVSEGKKLIALAVTDKGINTSAGDTFEQMAENIRLIQGGTGGGGCLVKQLVSFSMTAAEGVPQIRADIFGMYSDKAAVVKSYEEITVTVEEG